MLRCHGRGQVEPHPDRDGCGLVSRRHLHGRFAGIEGEDVKTFLKEVLLSLLIALCLAADCPLSCRILQAGLYGGRRM